MNLKEQIAEHLVKNRIEQALELLQSQSNLTIHLQNDIILLQQNHQDILYREQRALLTYEQVNVEKNKLNLKILQLTDNIVAGKPSLTLSNFTEQVPSKNLVLILLGLEITIGILGELFPENIKTSLRDALGSAYPIVYFSVLGLTIFAFLWFSLRKGKPKTTLNSINSFSKEEAKIRQALIERYHSRLKQKTDYRLPITLTLTYTKEGSSPDYLHFSKDMMETQKIEGSLLETLRKHHHILILGDPGAGKTTQILELAAEWLEKCEDHRIPIVFNLAGWKNDGRRFDEWLQDALVSGYGFSKQLAKEAIFKDKILPMLDGLDEVGRDLVKEEERNEIRSSCLHSIDQYLSIFDIKYLVICSRRIEYAAASADAPIKVAVLVNPLNLEEINSTLLKALTQKISIKDENAATSLRIFLSRHHHLKITICTPFYYNIALDVFDRRSYNPNLPLESESFKQFLLEHFISKKLTQAPNLNRIAAGKIQLHLAWLAHHLNMESKINFELTSFHVHHLDKKWIANFLFSQVRSLVLVLVGGLVGGLGGNLFEGLVIGLAGSLVLGLLTFGLVGDLNIEPLEIRKINWTNLTHKAVWMEMLVLGMGLGLAIGCGFGLVGGLIVGVVVGMVGGVVLGIGFGLIDSYSFTVIKTPYFRLKREIIFELVEWIFLSVLLLVSAEYATGAIQTIVGLLFVLGVGIIIGIWIGLTSTAFFKHLILRLCLYWENKLPFHLVSFLTSATTSRILEQDGGQWRFRHQILQDYFANKWEEQQAISKSAH